MKVPVPVKGSMRDVLVSEGRFEFVDQHVLDGEEDEINNRNRRIDDSEALGHLGECFFEKLVVELGDDLLLARSVIDAFNAFADGGVEFIERCRFFIERFILEHIQHGLHGAGDGISFGESVVFKEGIKHRAGDEVLGKHLDAILLRNGRVDVLVEAV